MTFSRQCTWLALAVPIALSGCQSKLNAEKIYQMKPAQIESFEFDGPRYDQKVVLTAESDGPVTIHVFLKKDRDAVEKALELGQKSDKVLGTMTGDNGGSMEVSVPAKQETIVRVESGKKPINVKVKVQGK